MYYRGTDVNVFDPCNLDASETLTTDGLGLDNDGDLAYDTADPDCPFFGDGFESQDLTGWSLTVP